MEQADGGRGEGLGHTADAEAQPWRQGDALLEIRPPQRLGPREFAIDGHGDRHARQVLVDDQVPRMPPDLLYRGGVSGGGRRKGLRGQRPRVVARARGQAAAGEDRGCGQGERQANCAFVHGGSLRDSDREVLTEE